MKPTSIIFLILSVVLIASGLGICFIAKNMAEAQGISLYSQSIDENDNIIDIIDLTNANVTRLSIKLKKGSVNIINHAEKSYIEMVNFAKNTYTYRMNARTVAISDSVEIMSVINFTENGFQFHGLRYYLTPSMYKTKEKIINIYLTTDEEVKVFDVDLSEGNLNMKNFTKRADYSINITKGNAEFEGVRTTSEFHLNVDEGNVVLLNTLISYCNVDINKGDLHFKVPNYKDQGYEIATSIGNIYYADEIIGNIYSHYLPISSTKLTVNIGTGDIYISKSEPVSTIPSGVTESLPEN